jgi:flagellar export protein FliJ
MAFQFPLETVLRLRRGQERLERLRLETIHSELAQTRATLEDLIEKSLELRRKVQRDLANTLSGSELQIAASQDETVALTRASLRNRIVELEQRRLAQMHVYTKVRQSRETFEKLRDNKPALYRMEQARREQQILDDLFLTRHDFSADE